MRPRKRRNKNRPKILIAIFVISIMVLSTIGFIVDFAVNPSEETQDIQYGDFIFTQTDQGLLTTDINGQQVTFFTFPPSVEYIQIPQDALDMMQKAYTIKVTYDVNATEAETLAFVQYSLEQSIPKVVGTVVERGITEAIDDGVLPRITCDDATFDKPVLYLKQGDDIRISYENGCIIAEAVDRFSILHIHDRLLYGMFGVITNV